MPDYSTTLSRGCKLLKGLGLCPPGRDNLSAGCLEIPGAAARAEAARDRDTPAMLGTLMTALFFVARVVRQVSLGWPGGSREHFLLQCCPPLPGAAVLGQGEEAAASACPSVPPTPRWAGGLGALGAQCCLWAPAGP